MATTKTRSTSQRGRPTGSRTTKSRASSTPSSNSSSKRDDGLAARTGRTIRDRPYASAAIAAGAASLVAGIAGLFAFKRNSGKSWSQLGDDLSTQASGLVDDATAKVREAKASLGEKLHRDGVDAEKSQAEIMQEALTLKQTGEQSNVPRDPIMEQDIKAGIATSNHEAKAGAKAYD
ncbi:MAG TPA: hypothetical protein VFO42_03460 [Sphingomicrobium sp.]|nr:hypothetical protein [Sphingomicrobium sp.]